ncbi:MAG TPA: sugar porter family MFS transporter [Acidobacteriaceae bacterium]
MKIKGYLVFATATTAIAGYLYGYDTGIISSALLPISSQFHLEHTMQEVVASAILVGAITGALTCGYLFERIGRKKMIITLAAIYVVGALLSSIAPNAILLILARIFLGFAVGGSSQTIPVYVAEVAPAEGRGHFVTSFNVAIGLGIVTANTVGATLHQLSWRWMIAAASAPALVFLFCSLKLPESSRWLVSQGRNDQARESLASVRDESADLDGELHEMEEIVKREKESAVKGWKGLTEDWVRPATIAALGIAAFTQLTGIEMMVYYAPTLLTGVGYSHQGALRSSLGLAIVYAVMTTTGLFLVERVGRRRLTLWMLPGAAVCLFLLGVVLAFHLGDKSHSWIVVVLLLSYMFFNAGGIQVVGWLSGSEMYPLAVRGAGSSAQAAMVWGADLLVTVTALTLVHVLTTGGTMWVYAGMNIAAFFFTMRFFPEVGGKSLEEVENLLHEGQFAPSQQAA